MPKMWNHNSHFHGYLLNQLPKKMDRALDIGCGLGLFAWKLAERAERVDALDINRAILKEASNQHQASNIHYLHANFLDADIPKESYDAIVSIASIHHMDLEAAIKKSKMLLRPNGKLLVLGLYREVSLLDYLYSFTSVPLNLMYLNWHRTSIENPRTIAPTRPAHLSLEQIKTVAKALIPGFCLQRHLFWRYSLIWERS